MREIDGDGRRELVPCRIELNLPGVLWPESYRICRLKGLSFDQKSFLFKMLHELLPSRERVSHLIPTSNPICTLCQDNLQETYLHCFFNCIANKEASCSLLQCAQTYAPQVTPATVLNLEVECEDPFLLPTVVILSTGLQLIWTRRVDKKITTVWTMRSELEARVSLLRKTRRKKLIECGNIIENIIYNFFH